MPKFEEQKHPRDKDGQFASKGGEGKSSKKSLKKKHVAAIAGLAAYLATGAVLTAKEKHERKQHAKISNKMRVKLGEDFKVAGKNFPGGVFNTAEIRRYVQDEQDKAVLAAGMPPEHVNKLAKQLHILDKFTGGSRKYKNTVVRALKKHYGIKTFRDRAVEAARQAGGLFRKTFKVYKTVRGPKLLGK